MKQIGKSFTLLCITILAALALSGCGDEDYYIDNPILGNWELVTVNGYPVNEYDVSEFSFYADGTGVYGQYRGGVWMEFPINWQIDFAGGGLMSLFVYPGGNEVWEYTVRDYGFQIELTDVVTRVRYVYQSY